VVSVKKTESATEQIDVRIGHVLRVFCGKYAL